MCDGLNMKAGRLWDVSDPDTYVTTEGPEDDLTVGSGG